MALGSSVYKMVFDTQGLSTLTASRREVALSKQIMEETRPAVEKYGDAWDGLNRLLNKDLISVQDYNRALIDIKSELPENAAALEALDSVYSNAASVRQSLMTAEDKLAESERAYGEAVKGVQTLLEARILTEEEAAIARSNLAQSSPAFLAAEKEQAEIHKNGQDILRSLVTEEQRFAETRAKAWQALQAGVIQETDYQQVLAKSPKAIAAAAEAERSRGDAIRRGIELNKEFTPASDRARAKLIELKAGYDAGHVSQSAYRNGLIQLTATQMTGIPVVGKMASSIASLGPIGAAAAAALAGVTIATKLMGSAIRITTDNVTEQIGKIDKLVAASETINVPVDQFQKMGLAANYANIQQQEFAGGTEKMLIGISRGADGSKKLVDAFNIIGLDAKKLRDMQPESAFREITRALDTVPNAADKARAATVIFGSADFLRIDTSHIDRASSLMDRLRASLDEVDATTFSEFDSNVKDMNMAFDVTWQKVAMEIVPALSKAADVATKWLVNINNNETFTDTLTRVGDALEIIAATANEVPGVIESWTPSLNTFLNAVKTANPKIAIAMEVVGLGGEVVGDATANIAEQVRRERELNAQLREIQSPKKTIIPEEDVDKAEKKTQDALRGIIAGLQDEQAKLKLSKEAYLERQVAMAGGGLLAMSLAVGLERTNEQLRNEAEAAKKAEDAEKRRQDAIKGTLTGLDEQLRQLQLSEREQLAYSLAVEKASTAETISALAKFDSIKALEKEQQVTKLAADSIKDLEKQLRQAGMTAEERNLDDLKVAGVGDEQLAIIDTLQKELALRKDITAEIQASSGAMKAGSREAADAFAKANQNAVLERFNRDRKTAAAGAPAGGESFVPPPAEVGFTSTAIPPEPVINSDPFEDAYRLIGKPNPLGRPTDATGAMERGISPARTPLGPVSERGISPGQTLLTPQASPTSERLLADIAGLIRQLVSKTGVTVPEIEDPTQ